MKTISVEYHLKTVYSQLRGHNFLYETCDNVNVIAGEITSTKPPYQSVVNLFLNQVPCLNVLHCRVELMKTRIPEMQLSGN